MTLQSFKEYIAEQSAQDMLSNTHYEMGLHHYNNLNYKKAHEYFKKAQKDAPNNPKITKLMKATQKRMRPVDKFSSLIGDFASV